MRNIRNPQPKALLRAMGECHLLDVNNLCGFGAGGGRTVKDSGYITTSTHTASAISWTHTAVSLGTPDPTRFIVIVTEAFSAGGAINSCTVGGIALTPIKNQYNAGREVAIYAGLVPTGLTADIVVTKLSSNSNYNLVSVFALYGLSSTTPYVTASSTANPGVVTSNVLKDSFGVSGSTHINSGGASFTWTGLTENYDVSSVGANNKVYSVASYLFTADESPRTMQASCTTTDYPCTAFAAWK